MPSESTWRTPTGLNICHGSSLASGLHRKKISAFVSGTRPWSPAKPIWSNNSPPNHHPFSLWTASVPQHYPFHEVTDILRLATSIFPVVSQPRLHTFDEELPVPRCPLRTKGLTECWRTSPRHSHWTSEVIFEDRLKLDLDQPPSHPL